MWTRRDPRALHFRAPCPCPSFVLSRCYLIRLILLSLDPTIVFFSHALSSHQCYPSQPCSLLVPIKAESLLLDAMSVVYQDRVDHYMDSVHGVLAHTSVLRSLLLHLLDRRQGWITTLGVLQQRGKVCHRVGPLLQHEHVAIGVTPITGIQCCIEQVDEG